MSNVNPAKPTQTLLLDSLTALPTTNNGDDFSAFIKKCDEALMEFATLDSAVVSGPIVASAVKVIILRIAAVGKVAQLPSSAAASAHKRANDVALANAERQAAEMRRQDELTRIEAEAQQQQTPEQKQIDERLQKDIEQYGIRGSRPGRQDT